MRYPPLNAPPPLVAVAHGSSNPAAAAAITDLMALTAARARRAGLGNLQVRAAYLGYALPTVPDVLVALHGEGHREAVVVPLLLTGAYHSDTDLPAVLCEAGARVPGLRISYGRPLGPHPGLLRALDRRLAGAGVTGPAGNTAVVLAAAGSSRPAANAATARVAAAWQAARGWRQVVPAYASAASPTPGQSVAGLRRAGGPRVVVATYLLAPGVFADQVRERSLAAGAQVVSPVLGAAPEVAELVLERYLQAAMRPDRAQTRRSAVVAPF
jgi:sirohydrochlorin ferrochelatase